VKVTTYSSFDVLPESYRQLFGKGAGQWYDETFPWFQNFERTALDAGDKVCIFGVEANGAGTPLAALAMRYTKRRSGRLAPARLSSLSNFYTITYSPAGEFSETNSAEVLQALAKAIATDRRGWDFVELRPLDPASSTYSQLLRSFKDAGMIVQPFFCFGNWYLPTEGLSFESYFESLPAAMQNTIRRKSKKLEKTGKARIEIVTGAEGLEEAIDAYERIYLSSWKRPEPYPHFVPGLIRTCAAKNWLRMGVIYLGEEPIAAQVWIVNADKATIYKLGHDQRYDEFSAGSILTSRLVQHVLDVDKVKEIDFGSGDDPYKKNWLSLRRERWGILAMSPRSIPGCFGIVRNIGGRAAKNVWRSLKRHLPSRRPAKSGPQENRMHLILKHILATMKRSTLL
jgi:hypothetical protein